MHWCQNFRLKFSKISCHGYVRKSYHCYKWLEKKKCICIYIWRIEEYRWTNRYQNIFTPSYRHRESSSGREIKSDGVRSTMWKCFTAVVVSSRGANWATAKDSSSSNTERGVQQVAVTLPPTALELWLLAMSLRITPLTQSHFHVSLTCVCLEKNSHVSKYIT